MQVIKASGEIEKFDKNKIYFSIREAGGSKRLAHSAVKEVRKLYHKNILTLDILKFLLNFLKQEPGVSQRYNLKRAIMMLGPTGFPFEKFFARVLEIYGYKTSIDNHLKGKRIFHEIDIVAEKEKKFMIECKYHNETGTITKLQPALYTYARFLDLSSYKFDSPWLVTNTKCSTDAINYAKGVNLKITGWNYPKNKSLSKLIVEKKIYPITILQSLPINSRLKLYELNIVILRDLVNTKENVLIKKAGINKKVLENVLQEIKDVLGGD